MIKKTLVIVFFFTISITAQQPPKNQSNNPVKQKEATGNSTPPINININLPSITNHAINSPASNIENKSNTNSASQASTHVESSNISVSSSHSNAQAWALNLQWGSYKPWYDNIIDFFKRNKKRFLIGGIASIYGTIYYHAVQGNYYLRSQLKWSTWHKEISFKQLRKIPYYQLTADLACSIQKRYISAKDPINFSEPLSIFMQELEKEEKKLHFYRQLYNWCSNLWIRRLFPFNVRLYKKISIRLRRIRFLKRSFIKWITEYKMEQNKTFARAIKLLQKPTII